MKLTEAASGAVLLEKVFLEISQISQENTSARVSVFKLTYLNGFLTREVMSGRKCCSEYIFLKKISAGLLDFHCFRFRMETKYDKANPEKPTI